MRKVTQVADILHTTIPISNIEKYLISTQEFNRLHGVLQNSTAYLTFPSVTHTRWAHSLGVMHLTGEIFKAGFRNASPEIRRRFLEDIRECLDHLTERDPLYAHEKSKRTLVAELDDYKTVTSFSDTFYEAQLAGACHGDESNEDWIALCAAYQAARLTGLMHDVGHLPFSHVAEHALEGLFHHLQSEQDWPSFFSAEELSSLNDSAKDEIRLFSTSISACKPINTPSSEDGHESLLERRSDPKLHEDIGFSITEHLFDSLVTHQGMQIHRQRHPTGDGRVISYDATEPGSPFKPFCFTYLCLGLSLSIFKSDFPSARDSCGAIYGIVNNSIDSDRLDFVSRDLIHAGMLNSKIPLDRLIGSYELVLSNESGPDQAHSKDTQTRPPSFRFVPSIRSISTIESVVTHRRMVYKYLVLHHRVQKTDSLLIDLIHRLAKQYFLQSRNAVPFRSGYEIANDISGLWTTFSKQKSGSTVDMLGARMSNFDDKWLIGVLRQEYQRLLHKPETERSKDEETIRFQMAEFLTNSKEYISVFKRESDYWNVDFAALEKLLERRADDGEKLQEGGSEIDSVESDDPEPRITQTKRRIHQFLTHLNGLSNFRGDNVAQYRYSGSGYITNYLHDLVFTGKSPLAYESFLQTALWEASGRASELGISDIRVRMTSFKPGIDDSFLVWNGEALEPISAVSSISIQEKSTRTHLPTFYAYIHSTVPTKADGDQILRFQRLIGQELADAYWRELGTLAVKAATDTTLVTS